MSEPSKLKVTVFSALSEGGIADYAHVQANALAARGIDVDMLCAASFLQGRDIGYKTHPILKNPSTPKATDIPLKRKLMLAAGILQNTAMLVSHVARHRPDVVLTHFGEYLAPLWAWRLRRLRREGIVFQSVLHDPVRSYKVGPQWWHDLSVKQAFSVYDTVFVHTHESIAVPKSVNVVWIPHGIYSFPPATRSAIAIRRELSIPETALVLTAFGYIRDNKNIDLVLRAISDLKEVFLVVAGSDQDGGNKPMAFYQKLAHTLGCGDRCRWINRFLDPLETANLLCASDLALLTYSRSFASASGVLNLAVNYHLPCLISGGSKTTEDLVRRYGLGVWAEPDSAEAIRAGLQDWMKNGISPDWEGYNRENSWARNAELVHEVMLAATQRRSGMGS